MIVALLLACTAPTGGPSDATTGWATLVDTGTPPLTTQAPEPVVATRPVGCPDPAARDRQPFDTVVSWPDIAEIKWFFGAGVVVADFDGNGVKDMFFAGVRQPYLYMGTGDGWVRTPNILMGLPVLASTGGSAADYDGDGDADVFVTRFLQPDVLLRNEGDHFVDVSAEAGISAFEGRGTTSSWADIDHDGDLDLFVGSYGFLDQGPGAHSDFEPGDPSFLYRNDGDGTFTDVSDLLPQSVHDGYTLAGGFHDLDLDGWLDLYVVNDFGVSTPNQLLWNRNGRFEADDNRSGLDVSITGMGLAVADVNGDRVPDLFAPEWNGLHVYESGRYDTWIDWAVARGLTNDLERDQKIGWAGQFADFDNDGDLDLPVSFGHLTSVYDSPEEQPDALFVRQDDGSWVDEAAAWGVDHPGVSRGAIATDMNDDGWLDLIVRNVGGSTRMYLSRCGDAAWLRVRLHQDGANPDAIGARIAVSAGDRVFDRVVRAGGTSYASAGPPEVHVGLADLAVVDVEVVWPDGEVSVFPGLETRQVVDITR